MKKAILGYSISEVDESIDYLETRNIKLEKQVRQLSEDLERVRGELRLYEDSPNGTDDSDGENERLTGGLRAELDSLKLAYSQSENERERLSGEISRLNSKLAEQGEAFADVGNICRLAYEDMHNTKRRAKESIEDFLRVFWSEWEEYRRRVCDLSEEIKRRQFESRNFFIESADQILHVYGSMNQSNREFESGLSEIINAKDNLQTKLKELLAGLDEDVRDDDMAQGAAEDGCEDSPKQDCGRQEEKELYSILRSVKAMHENCGCSDRSETAVKKAAGAEIRPAEASDKAEIFGNVTEGAENRTGVCLRDTEAKARNGAEPRQTADMTDINDINGSFSISPEVNMRNII